MVSLFNRRNPKLGKKYVVFAHDIIHKYPEALAAVQKENAIIYYWDYSNKKQITRLFQN